jgi:hypothetical protein
MIVQDVKVLCPAELREALLGTALHLNNAFAPLYNRSSSRPKPPVINRVNRQREMMAGARRKSADEQAADAAIAAAEAHAAAEAAATATGPASKAGPDATSSTAAAAAGSLERTSSMGASALHRSSMGSAAERCSDAGTTTSQCNSQKDLVSNGSLQRIIHSRHVSRDNRTEVVEDEDALLALLLEQNAAHRHQDPVDEEQMASRATSTTELHDASTSSLPMSPISASDEQEERGSLDQAPVLELAIEFVQVQVSSAVRGCNSGLAATQAQAGAPAFQRAAFSM